MTSLEGLKTCFLFTALSKQAWQLSFPKDNVESLKKKLKIHFSKFVNSLFVSRRKLCKVLLLNENISNVQMVIDVLVFNIVSKLQ